MQIISFNCNGIRSSLRKGFFEWLKKVNPDILCLQETKAYPHQMQLDDWKNLGYHDFHHTAKKPGYSSVSIFTKILPKKVITGINHPFFDEEGRSIALEFSNFLIWNVYFPSGTSGEERQSLKMEFLNYFLPYSKKIKKKYPNTILCGDVNIAHTELDIHNPKGNEKNSGFLPEEREWLTQFINSGWIDCYRFFHPKSQEYTWWSYRFHSRKQNKGWRIDYFFTTSCLLSKIINCGIYHEFNGSDHAPIYLIFDSKDK